MAKHHQNCVFWDLGNWSLMFASISGQNSASLSGGREGRHSNDNGTFSQFEPCAQLTYHSLQYEPSRSSKVVNFHVIWKPICNLWLAINSKLSPISHCLATIHLLQTDRQTTMPIARPILKYSRLKTKIKTNCDAYSQSLRKTEEKN